MTDYGKYTQVNYNAFPGGNLINLVPFKEKLFAFSKEDIYVLDEVTGTFRPVKFSTEIIILDNKEK